MVPLKVASLFDEKVKQMKEPAIRVLYLWGIVPHYVNHCACYLSVAEKFTFHVFLPEKAVCALALILITGLKLDILGRKL